MRMTSTHTLRGGKKATNVSISSELLLEARQHNINLSATLEQALIKALKAKQQAQWLAENQQAIAAYNLYIENHGVFSDGFREF
jgi:antitoxin CcdA